MKRFEVEASGIYTLEFDRLEHELRISWSGGQVFLTDQECRDLFDLLLRVLFIPARRLEAEQQFLDSVEDVEDS